MSFLGNLDVGDALSNIKATRDASVERNFQDELNDISTKYSGALDVEGNLEKFGGTALGFIGAVKGVNDVVKKAKAKYKEFKEAKQKKQDESKEDEEDADADEDAGDLPDGLTEEDYNQVISDFQDGVDTTEANPTSEIAEPDDPTGIGDFNIEENPFDSGDLFTDGRQFLNDLVSSGKDRVQEIVNNYKDQPQVGETELEQRTIEVPDSELGGGEIPTSEPAGSGLGDIELAPVKGATQQPSTETDDAGFTGEGDAPVDDVGEALGNATTDAGETAGDLVSGTTEALTDAGSTIASTATEATAAGLESAGAVADSLGAVTFGVSDIIGAILGIAGLAVGAGTTIAGAVGSAVSTGDEESEEQSAEAQEKTDLANPPDYQGRVASGIQSSVAGFL